ncbi:unnamed protein product [Vitrella brassicaformis CCMP3155]|uniref:YchJ-like middle NTF2-like domain-containing protein n=1 Tax=Vitrella brassicaformis (strain CCMP3155) TaxID=1169540 RepID=A0A0G4EYD9_VITBC|nr:unnamed protein product [Vitrella brassicaformis CCMP3155]|eukprot:CEM04155.1 unnamed protein product [Vitrella brassicaformis CCMP3155]
MALLPSLTCIVVAARLDLLSAFRPPPLPPALSTHPSRRPTTSLDVFKGFGAAPPATSKKKEDPTAEHLDDDCPCFEGKLYKDCCRPLHKGVAQPADAEQLLRARFCAHAFKVPRYILTTTSIDSDTYKENQEKWERKTKEILDKAEFENLQIKNITDIDGDHTSIEFTYDVSGPNRKTETKKEKSYFVKSEGGRWMFLRSDKPKDLTADSRMKKRKVASGGLV